MTPTTMLSEDIRSRVHPSLLADFVPLPSRPDELLPEHAELVLGGDVDTVLREIVQLSRTPKQVDQLAISPEKMEET